MAEGGQEFSLGLALYKTVNSLVDGWEDISFGFCVGVAFFDFGDGKI